MEKGMVRFTSRGWGSVIAHCFSTRSLGLVEEALRNQHFNIYYLDAHRTVDKLSLFQEIKANLPYWGGEIGIPSWDAMNDDIDDAIRGEELSRVAIIWSPGEELLRGRLWLFLDMLSCLSFIEWNSRWGRPDPHGGVIIQMFLIGEGDNFPDFDAAEG